MGVACPFYLKSRHRVFLFLILQKLSLGHSLSLSPDSMSDFQRWELGFSLNRLGGGYRGNLCSCSAPESRLCTWMHTFLLGSFFRGMKQINCERIPGISLCALSLQRFSQRLHEKKKFRSLKCPVQKFQNKQGSPAFSTLYSIVNHKNNFQTKITY